MTSCGDRRAESVRFFTPASNRRSGNMLWLEFSLAVIVDIAGLWWFAMRQRNR